VKTLLHWKNRLGQARKLECSHMQLIGRDHEGAFISGPGRIDFDDSTGIRFFIYGSTADSAAAFRKMNSTRDRPYEALEQFRLLATDYEGNEWNGGYTAVDFFVDHKHGWPLSGELRSIVTKVSGPWVAEKSGVELLFMPPFQLPMNEWAMTRTTLGEEELVMSRQPGRQVIEVLGTKVVFANDTSDDALWITAETSDQLRHPHLEWQLSEPLRILLGSAVYPKLISRNFGDGSAFVNLVHAPRLVKPSAFGLMQSIGTGHDHVQFWKFYANILQMVATDKGNSGLDAHPVTRLYDELWQAQKGSRWGIVLTLASTVEALAKSLMSDEDKRSEFPESDLDGMKEHLQSWKGDSSLRERMISSLGFLRNRSTVAFLRGLVAANSLDSTQLKTWQRVRNSVMHGELVEPWATEEGDRHLQELVALVHGLTKMRIANGSISSGASSSTTSLEGDGG
jgi:hypothetical protein